MNSDNEKIEHNIELSESEKQLCDSSYMEIVYYYILNPFLFINHFYQSITTLSWKFYF